MPERIYPGIDAVSKRNYKNIGNPNRSNTERARMMSFKGEAEYNKKSYLDGQDGRMSRFLENKEKKIV